MLSPTVLKLLRSPVFLISATTLLCLLISASLLRHQHHERLEIRTNHYGNALASLAAKQATEATMNHDLVSLQVIVSDIARNPDILSVTVHDVENRLLVQAGGSPNSGDYAHREHRLYSAPVTLQDSIAGYVTVNIDTQAVYEQRDDTWLMALLGLAGAMRGLSINNQRQQTDTSLVADTAETPTELTSNPAAHARSHGEEDVYVTLYLHCLNWGAIKQQLSPALRQQLYTDLQRHLSGINALYAGRITLADNDTLELEFHGDEMGNTTFRAICAAQLLFLLLQRSSGGLQLRYAGAIFPSSKGTGLNIYLQQARHRRQLASTLAHTPFEEEDQGLLLNSAHCATSQLLQRLQTGTELVDGQWLEVAALRPSYQGLLNKQARQLQGLQSA